MIIVTGANGFIGKNFINRLDNAVETYDIIPIDIDNAYKIFETPIWEHVTKIYHFGAISDTTETDIEKIFQYNIHYSIKLFEGAINHKIPVVYASSASVYGNSTYKRFNPLNYYSLSKATIDYWVIDNMNKFSNIVGLRFFNVYGAGEENKKNQASPIHQFTKQAKETGVIKVFKNSSTYFRDFVWVEDCIDCALENKESGIYDVGTSRPVSFLEVAELISKKYNAKIQFIDFPEHLKNKYQIYTQAQKQFNKNFKTIGTYINEL
jgi:ADP-L-glycero-D-manno-heptose 6-epimerase